MKRVFAVGGKVVVLDVPEPTLRRNEVLVAPIFSAISAGTESGIIRGSDPATPASDVFKATPPARPKLRMHPRDTVRLARARVDRAHPLQQPPVSHFVRTGWPLAPGVKARL